METTGRDFLSKVKMSGYQRLLFDQKKVDSFDVVPKESEYDGELSKDESNCSQSNKKGMKLREKVKNLSLSLFFIHIKLTIVVLTYQ